MTQQFDNPSFNGSFSSIQGLEIDQAGKKASFVYSTLGGTLDLPNIFNSAGVAAEKPVAVAEDFNRVTIPLNTLPVAVNAIVSVKRNQTDDQRNFLKGVAAKFGG